MNPFWKTFFEELKERGHNASLFVFTLLCVSVVLIITTSCRIRLDHVMAFLPGLGVFAAAMVCVAWRRKRKRQRERAPIGPLSCDELRVARSKLTRDRNRKSA